MRQQSYYSKNNKRKTKALSNKVKTGAIVLVLFLIFVFGVKWFRGQPIEAPSDLHTISLEDVSGAVPVLEFDPLTKQESVDLSDVAGGSSSGIATREIEDGLFRHVVKSNLPDINEETHFYEGWLVRPLPFDFFSTGSMVHNEDGQFVLEWFGGAGEKYEDYTKVVITIEPRDNDPAPGKHIQEGAF